MLNTYDKFICSLTPRCRYVCDREGTTREIERDMFYACWNEVIIKDNSGGCRTLDASGVYSTNLTT